MEPLLSYTEHYDLIVNELKNIPFNTLFAQAVLKQKVDGKIYVDNIQQPETFYILHPYGMSLLFGKSDNTVFNQKFKEYITNSYQERNLCESLQAYPTTWNEVINDSFLNDSMVSPLIEVDTRINFKFDKAKHLAIKNSRQAASDIIIKSTSEDDFEQMTGVVIPACFWPNSNDFKTRGFGQSLFYNNELATIAFSAFIDNEKLELGIETKDGYRGKNFAYEACASLIAYCIEKELEPIWACRLSNEGSYKLAEKLGFSECMRIPYYKINLPQ